MYEVLLTAINHQKGTFQQIDFLVRGFPVKISVNLLSKSGR